MSFEYPKGSEWRKWDLHVHTPFSIVQNFKKNDTNSDIWESYITDLENLPREFKVLGINDYLFIDGYKKVLEYKERGRLQNIDLLLPVVEFRIKKFSGTKAFKRVNFHVILSNEIAPNVIQTQFLNRLSGNYKLEHGDYGDFWNGIIDRESLEELGKKIKASVPLEQLQYFGSDLKEGFNNLNLDENIILNILEESSFLSGKYLTAIGKTEWDSFKWNDSSIAEKKDVINKVHFVFTAAESVEKYNNAKNKLTEQNVNNLLLDCSDAHTNSWFAEKDRIGNCNTWIKADPVFEGLKQVYFEPIERLKIQQDKPEEKKPYYVIKKVQFIDPQLNRFQKAPIHLNPNLNCIIGGRSTGKSLLLYHIAKTIDPSLFERFEKVGLDFGYELEKEQHFDFEVHWEGGEKNTIKSLSNQKKIIYIPQEYLSALTKQNRISKKSLNKFIIDLLLEQEHIKEEYEQTHNLVKEKVNSILTDINQLYIVIDDINGIYAKIKELGNKKGVQEYILKIKSEIKEIKEKAKLTPEESELYDSLVKEGKAYRDIDSELKSDKKIVSEFFRQTTSKINEIIEQYDHYSNQLQTDTIKNEFEEKLNFLNRLLPSLKSSQDTISGDTEIEGSIDKLLASNKEKIALTFKKIKPTHDRVKLEGNLKEKDEILRQEEIRLKSIESEIKKGQSRKLQLDKLKEKITTSYCEIISLFQTLIDKFNANLIHLNAEPDLDINLMLDYDSIRLSHQLNNKLFKKDLERELGKYSKEYNENGFLYKYDLAYHSEFIKELFTKVFHKKIKLTKSSFPKELINSIFANNFILDFNIRYKNDSLYKMSPGKKNLALLKILIHLSTEEWPILIDQPEDDLDNRSIYTELVYFLRDKKVVRQIIAVTHNPNVVVGGDAEAIVVANQKGQEQGRENASYDFEYVSGSLENDFLKADTTSILQRKGIRSHVCELLEGGEEAFVKREQKYDFIKK